MLISPCLTVAILPSLARSLTLFSSNSEILEIPPQYIGARKEDYSHDFQPSISVSVDRSEFACYSRRRIFSTPPTPPPSKTANFIENKFHLTSFASRLRDIKYPGAVLRERSRRGCRTDLSGASLESRWNVGGISARRARRVSLLSSTMI